MTHPSRIFRILTLLFAAFTVASAQGETLFADDFVGPNLNPIWQPSLPNAPWRFGAGVAIFQGAANFSFQLVDGSSVIRLQNVLNDAQRRGWSSSTSFPADAPIVYRARFNTLLQSSTTGIDELLEIWLLDAKSPANYDKVALSAPEFGSGRVFTAESSITAAGLDTNFAFANNTWYRMVISGSMTQEVRASIYDDSGTKELLGVNLGHNLSAYPAGFKIGISQSMGLPHAPFPTDVAIDSVSLTATQADDSDGDGVPDKEDQCPNSDLSATVSFDACDSKVPNTLFPSGCSIADLGAACAEGARQHGQFSRCVFRLADDLKRDRIISDEQERAIQRCAIRR